MSPYEVEQEKLVSLFGNNRVLSNPPATLNFCDGG
jgi:hypothetical protein